jgi:hypothetical protein
MSKRSETLGLHSWSEQDNILALYYTKHGNSGLYLKDETALANWIGSSVGSLKMQAANFRTLMGQIDGALSDYSKTQLEVFNTYGKMSKFDLMRIVKSIIGQDTYERNQILIKMGKNPNKMVKI